MVASQKALLATQTSEFRALSQEAQEIAMEYEQSQRENDGLVEQLSAVAG